MIRFILNRDAVETGLPAGTVMLDFLRQGRGLTGVKEGCREGDCGACMVLIGEPHNAGIRYRAVNSCLLPLGEAAGRHVVTIEGLNLDALTPGQQAFVDEGAAQCGFCTPGFMVSLAGFLLSAPRWDADAATDALAGNLCRCTGYLAIRRAIQRICGKLGAPLAPGSAERIRQLIAGGWLPDYFAEIAERLQPLALSPPAVSSVEAMQLEGRGVTTLARTDVAGRGVYAASITKPEGALGLPPKSAQHLDVKRTEVRAPAIWVAGGTDLFVQRPEELAEANLTFLSRREDLRGIRVEGDQCVLGAATTWAELEDSPVLREVLPGLADHLKLAASRPIRQRATVAGNLVNASPIADLAILLLALDAAVVLVSEDNPRREVRLHDFFLGYKQLAKRPDELVAEVRFPVLPPGAVFSFEKVSRRRHLDIASVNSALLGEVRDGTIVSLRISAGGVAPIPLLLTRTSAQLKGTSLTVANLRAALTTAQTEISPISDVRGSADYRRRLLRQLLLAHFLKLAPALEEELVP